ncbi:hypothetical protein OJ253_2674 [Cryptosporidium canis]|uniref:rRNA biogenesis protein RRP36 n=1 Tax=Cryptosporidium canis TaxID=195482 RepID=A0A9D5HUZ2_9CRYT|nr:hypothetical protein OJ253_2674 [Cryptosporidium canis]
MDFEDIPFEEILKKERLASALERKKVNLDSRNINSPNKASSEADKNNSESSKRLKKYGRILSKNSPMEVSSRRQVLPEKLENERNYIRNKYNDSKRYDPRFNDSCGKLNTDLFHKSYTFLEDIRQEEFDQIKNTLDLHKTMTKSKELGTWNKVKKLSKFKNSDVMHLTDDQIDNLKLKYQKLVSEKNHRKNLFLKQQTISQHRKQEQAKIESGKKPFFLKQKDINISIQDNKYKQLNKKQRSKLEQKINRKHDSKFKPPKSLRNI